MDLLPQYDGWIIGDDPATGRVFEAGRRGRLRAAVKWGVGTDNVDFVGARASAIPVVNTPNAFGREVADLAMCYVTMLSRQVHVVDAAVKGGGWVKPAGGSLAGKTVALVGYGDIGMNIARRLKAADMRVHVYDPYTRLALDYADEALTWPSRVDEADFIVLACALTAQNRHLIDTSLLTSAKPGVHVINVSRGPLIDEKALVAALRDGVVASAALDVFEVEPLPVSASLREFGDRCVFGSHNASNTREAVLNTSLTAVRRLHELMIGEGVVNA